jgi:hypothetical protein
LRNNRPVKPAENFAIQIDFRTNPIGNPERADPADSNRENANSEDPYGDFLSRNILNDGMTAKICS